MGNFQNIFKRLRTSSRLTQAEMAEKLGISRSTIGMYETGAREPDFETLEKIADFSMLIQTTYWGEQKKPLSCQKPSATTTSTTKLVRLPRKFLRTPSCAPSSM